MWLWVSGDVQNNLVEIQLLLKIIVLMLPNVFHILKKIMTNNKIFVSTRFGKIL